MKFSGMLPFRTTLLGLAWLVISANADDGLSQEYCSSENTGADYQGVVNIYQSNGACSDQCRDNYAFAIVQYQTCWCSNYIPADQQSTGNCNQNCPGFPSDLCGNENDGMYGYIALGNAPSGTAGAATSTSQAPSSTYSPPVSRFSNPTFVSTDGTTATSSPASPVTSRGFTPPTAVVVSPTSSLDPPSLVSSASSSRTSQLTFVSLQSSSYSQPSTSTSDPPTTSYVSQTVTQLQTVTHQQTQKPATVVSTVTPTPSTSTSSDPLSSTTALSSTYYAPVVATSSASSSSTSATGSAVTSIRVTTISGAVVTQTVTSTPMVMGGDSAQAFQRKGLSGGAVAGIVLGVLLGLAALALAAFLLWRRKRKADTGDEAATGRPKRTTSVLSRTGLLGRQSMHENTFEEGPYNNAAGTSSVRHSMLFGAGAAVEGVHPSSPLGSSQDNASSTRRHSKPMVYDQRLNPSAIFANAEANGSRVSMQDQQDYSRPLGVANPDYRASFDSR